MSDRALDLRKPKDARTLLRGVRIKGKEITNIHLANGKTLSIEELTDEQACFYANQVYTEFLGGKEGGFVDIEPSAVEQ